MCWCMDVLMLQDTSSGPGHYEVVHGDARHDGIRAGAGPGDIHEECACQVAPCCMQRTCSDLHALCFGAAMSSPSHVVGSPCSPIQALRPEAVTGGSDEIPLMALKFLFVRGFGALVVAHR